MDKQSMLNGLRKALYNRSYLLKDYNLSVFLETVYYDVNDEINKIERNEIFNVIRDPDEE